MAIRFELLKIDPSGARLGRLHTPHGVFDTPMFMPVGTAASVKGVAQPVLEELGAGVLLANTYHLYLRPGHERIAALGGLHRFMSWPRGLLTDSGGFQVFSLAELRRVTDEGVAFRSHLDGSEHFLSPERAVEIQAALGADIAMVLDECIAFPASHEHARAAAHRTLSWARRAKQHLARTAPSTDGARPAQATFAIVQGGAWADLRRESADALVEMDFPGYAVGGLAVGEPHALTVEMTAVATERLPRERPRYLMGVGMPEDIADYVAAGVDMMDCVLPTRNARNGSLFTRAGRLAIRNARFASDPRPPDERCGCGVCRRYSRAYLRHLFLAGEMLGPILASQHNLAFYFELLAEIRRAIAEGTFAAARARLARQGGLAAEV
jgi:queuine tRNA-ribosyltransferase